jgi:hypothetical protein
MPQKKQVGGMQEVFFQLKAKDLKGTEKVIRAIEKAGGRILHAYPPEVVVASVPAARATKVAKLPGVASASSGEVKASVLKKVSPGVAYAVRAWNDHVSAQRQEAFMVREGAGLDWDAEGRTPPHPPAEIERLIRGWEAQLAPAMEAKVQGAPVMSIPVLVGRIGVGVVFVDSTVSQYAITDAEKSKVISETTEGLNMLGGFEPRAGIQWFYDLRRPKVSLQPSAFPAGNKNGWEDTWRNAALGAMGYAASAAGMNKYIADIKAKFNAQHAYALFVTKHPVVWFGYQWGNHVVMDFGVDGWGIDNFNLVVAHETGHVFGCPDEYAASGCNCTSLFGRYQIANGNCQPCASPFVPCLMCANTPAVCDYTRGHLGWNELAVQSEGTTTLKGTWTFDFDTGVQGPAGGADVWWEQINTVSRLLVPQSGAMLAPMGKPNFDAVSLPTLKTQAYTANPINGSNNALNKLKPGTVIAIKTSAGRYAKMKVDTYGYNLGISWVTYK